MMLASILCLSVPFQQFDGLPRFTYKPAVMVGQREIILGPQLQPDTVMEVRVEGQTEAPIGEGKFGGATFTEYAKGYVRWSVTSGTMFEKPCFILKSEGLTKGENVTKTKRIAYACQNFTTYWIRPDGKLLRQSVILNDPFGKRHAEAVFWPDHIEVSIADSKNNRSLTMYPNIDMSLLDAMFKPMMDGEKVLTSFKEYCTFDPFTQAFTKYKAEVSGSFKGSWLGVKFEGRHVNITGPKESQVAFMSKENDLVRVDLPEHTCIVLNFLPHDKDPFYKAILPKSSGG